MPIAIKAEHLSKEYRLGSINHGMLYKDLQSWLARKLGRPDPHAPIGADKFANQSGHFWALKDVSFEIEQGDRVGIIGKNGAGKSTLLKILSRITAPTEGVIGIRGRVSSLLEVGTGFHPELTGRENVYLNGAILGMKRKEIDRKFDEIVAFSEIENFIDTPAKRYSSGMYVRLAFAVAAYLESDILIADEVLAVGDVAFQKKCLGKMEDVSKNQGRTVLFVSHNMASIKALCEYGILLDNGRIKKAGSVSHVVSEYTSNFINFNGIVELGNCKPLIDTGVVRVLSIEQIGRKSKTLKFVFRFECPQKINNLWFGMNISTSDGVLLSCLNSIDSVGYYSFSAGQHYVILEFADVFLPGSFLISVGAAVSNSTVFWVENVFSINLGNERISSEGHYYKRNGLLNLDSQWSLHE